MDSKQKNLPYRQTEGVVRAHASNKLPSIPNYSTISRRVNNQDIKIGEDVGNEVVTAFDSTGIKVANRGEWMRHKWRVRRGYLKIHVAVDIKNKKIFSLEVTSEEIVALICSTRLLPLCYKNRRSYESNKQKCN